MQTVYNFKTKWVIILEAVEKVIAFTFSFSVNLCVFSVDLCVTIR
jgi:hypothetical protein